ncbi:unnamed protein product [Urochloa humidicola]
MNCGGTGVPWPGAARGVASWRDGDGIPRIGDMSRQMKSFRSVRPDHELLPPTPDERRLQGVRENASQAEGEYRGVTDHSVRRSSDAGI